MDGSARRGDCYTAGPDPLLRNNVGTRGKGPGNGARRGSGPACRPVRAPSVRLPARGPQPERRRPSRKGLLAGSRRHAAGGRLEAGPPIVAAAVAGTQERASRTGRGPVTAAGGTGTFTLPERSAGAWSATIRGRGKARRPVSLPGEDGTAAEPVRQGRRQGDPCPPGAPPAARRRGPGRKSRLDGQRHQTGRRRPGNQADHPVYEHASRRPPAAVAPNVFGKIRLARARKQR